MDRMTKCVRMLLFAFASNVSLFLFASFLHDSLLIGSPFMEWQEQVGLYYDYLIVPWAMALCALRLGRNTLKGAAAPGWDIKILAALLVWLVAPFELRFGWTKVNASSWFRHAAVFFAIYAWIVECGAQQREDWLDSACAVFSIYALVLGSLLLYCVWRVQSFALDGGDYGFGVCDGMYLCSGVHYNTLGMAANCLLMLCLAACARRRLRLLRPLSAIAAAEMALVIVLTQSRTARYAMLIALACGACSAVFTGAWHKRALVRGAAGVAAAALVMVGGYRLTTALNDTVIAHYNRTYQLREGGQDEKAMLILMTEPALAEGDAAAVQEAQPEVPLEAREAIDATFSDRTNIWKNIFAFWQKNPKNFLIGNGAGRSYGLIVQGTIHETQGYVPMHNAYLQFIADYGLIGFALLCAFFATLIRPVIRVFLARESRRRMEDVALGMLVIACLATGMMESAPLDAFTPMNMVLFFALAMLSARGRELRTLVKEQETVV